MKKLLAIVLSVVLVLAFAAVSMAEVAFSGELDAGYKSYSASSDYTTESDGSMPYLFGKLIMNGKLGDSVSTCIVLKDADDDIGPGDNSTHSAENNSKMVFDEADATFLVPFGNIKVGYWGWNPKYSDIVDPLRADVKTDAAFNPNFNITKNLTFGVVYAFGTSDADGNTDGTSSGYYGANLSYATDSYGFDLVYADATQSRATAFYSKAGAADGTNDNDRTSVGAVNVWYLVNGCRFYIQYEQCLDDAYVSTVDSTSYDQATGKTTTTYAWNKADDDPSNILLGINYDNADVPVYGRLEYDASNANDQKHMTGVRVGYKLTSGAKLEAQYYGNIYGGKDSKDYVKVVCPF
jgi:hypothetical protein